MAWRRLAAQIDLNVYGVLDGPNHCIVVVDFGSAGLRAVKRMPAFEAIERGIPLFNRPDLLERARRSLVDSQ